MKLCLCGELLLVTPTGKLLWALTVNEAGRGNFVATRETASSPRRTCGEEAVSFGGRPLNPRLTPTDGAAGRSVNHDPDAQPQVVLTRAGDEERLPHRLERRRRQDDAGLLVAAVDDVPVDLPGAHVDAVVELDVDAAAEGHREARLVDVEVADPEYVRQLRAV